MPCPRCHQDNPPHARFCLECGTSLGGAVPAERSLAELLAENENLKRSLGEALEQQTATAEILKVISSSPNDLQPVFDTIVEHAVKLCGAAFGGLHRIEDGRITLNAQYGMPPDELMAIQRDVFPLPISRESATGRAILDRAVVHIRDIREDPHYRTPRLRTMHRYRTLLDVPMIHEGAPIGALALWRPEVKPFTDAEIGLVQTFADQAVIAIENVRLFKELESRNTELRVSLEQQLATSDLLKVIGRSAFDLHPVFQSLAESAARLCEAEQVTIFRFDGHLFHAAVTHNLTPAHRQFIEQTPIPPGRQSGAGRAALERRAIHIHDVRTDAEYTYGDRQLPYRTLLAIPLLSAERVLGAISIQREEVRPFTDNQIALMETFADQAAIAIENVRLFKELEARNNDLTESLERQTATADILRAISQAQTDPQPVFEAIVDSAMRLFGAWTATVFQYDGELVSLAAARGGSPGSSDAVREQYGQLHRPVHAAERVVRTKAVQHVADVETDPSCSPDFRRIAAARGFRSFIAVPMLRGADALGLITVGRAEPGVFSAAEIGLLQTFADQAVIAVENARLLAELQTRTAELWRSVGELQALGEVGRAVSSTLDLQTVLDTIVTRAVQLSGTGGGFIYEYDDTTTEFHLRATHQVEEELAEALRVEPIRLGEGATGRAAATRAPVQVVDALDEREYTFTRIRSILARLGYRSVLAVPLLLEQRVLGSLVVQRRESGTFAPEVVNLLQTFATQSALAIQNARLFREIEDKSRQLEVASQHKSEFLASMSHELRTPLNAIIGYSELLEEEAGDLDGGRLVPDLQKIATAAKHQLSLINDILDLSKVEAGRMELEVADFDLPSAIDNALTLVRERATRRGITLGTAIDERVGAIRADERKVKQVLLNLLSNALKFTPERGRINVGASVNGGLVEVSVADTGVGIAPEDQEAAFEEFRQVGSADKKVEGTGLGLALCRKFVELHGGRIWVESEVGKGSTFFFSIPLRLEAARTA